MPAGRPSKYDPKYDLKAYEWIRDHGLSVPALGKFLGVCKATINNWMRENPEFLAAVKRGRGEYFADTARRSLNVRLKGKRYTETTRELKDGEMVVTRRVTKQVQPSDTAVIFALKNKAGWKDRQEIDHSGSISVEVVSYASSEGDGKDQD